MNRENPFSSVMRTKTDEYLIEVINSQYGDFNPESVEAAVQEIDRRKSLKQQLSGLSDTELKFFINQKHDAIDLDYAREEAEKRNLIMSENTNKKTISGVVTAILIVLAIVKFGIRFSQNNHSYSLRDEDPIERTYEHLTNADRDTIHLWNEESISISMPKNMRRTISDSTYMDVEETYRTSYLDVDVFRISIIRQSKSYCRDKNIKNLQSFVTYWQTPVSSVSEKYSYTKDTAQIMCLADKNGYSSLYYNLEASDSWGKKAFINGKYDYYVVTVWTHPDYKYRFNDLINKTLTSFNIKK